MKKKIRTQNTEYTIFNKKNTKKIIIEEKKSMVFIIFCNFSAKKNYFVNYESISHEQKFLVNSAPYLMNSTRIFLEHCINSERKFNELHSTPMWFSFSLNEKIKTVSPVYLEYIKLNSRITASSLLHSS